MADNYTYFMRANLSNYIGKWVAILDESIVSSGDNAKKVYEEALKKHPKSDPLLARVPEKKAMIF